MIVLEAKRSPDDGPDAGTDIREDMNVGLEFGYSLVVVRVEHGHESLPNVEHAEHVPQDGRNVEHQVGGDKPERHHHRDFGRVLAVAGSWHATH